ncbi:response regulator transcription factor [Candidatus Kaiserbacteria bacterium]|nr:response regulator transcription factor [Candidatus Kaiserbacteria bacterium]USN92356.1 MAG: response regulator transcription factor [Candidatus Nomurabacteria bacterium]
MKILVVEDTDKLAKYIKQALEYESYAVDVVGDGATAERRIINGGYDLIILDVMLPEQNGVVTCRNVRAVGDVTPILMLTAKGEIEDRVEGLDSGADDYLIKPFAMEELIARTRALLRRPTSSVCDQIIVQDVSLNCNSRTVKVGRNPVTLTLKEYAVLEYLMRNAGSVVTREQLLDHCWDFSYSAFSNITDVYIKQLRQKLGGQHDKYIKTIRGVGYAFQN